MTKLAKLMLAQSFVHPNAAAPASMDQRIETPLGATPMTKVLSLTAALVLFVPVAAVFLYNTALMIA